MKNLYLLTIAATALALLYSHLTYAQTGVAKETKILEQQLNLLSAANKSNTGKESFEFDGCKCKYSYSTSADKGGFNMSKSNDFELKDVSSVNYAKNENNSYELRIKLKTDDNSVAQVFDLSSINVNLYTSDEKQIKDITNRLKNVVKSCSSK